ncbi:MAG: nitroreductase family protein [Gemmatimonadota bacterium]|nr:MAG: nitroreductase family protein [Gemmatimonadota bacterium]
MHLHDAIHARRSVKRYTDAPVARETIEHLLETVVHAPNHRMTQPWRFYVLGPEARRAYGETLGARKAKRDSGRTSNRGRDGRSRRARRRRGPRGRADRVVDPARDAGRGTGAQGAAPRDRPHDLGAVGQGRRRYAVAGHGADRPEGGLTGGD